jgi:uncharacterized membrane protein
MSGISAANIPSEYAVAIASFHMDVAAFIFLDRNGFRTKDLKSFSAGYPNTSMQKDTLSTEEKIAVGLGLFSIGLGLSQLIAPRQVARASGLKTTKVAMMRAFGAREVAAGVGILTRRKTGAWLWGRVAGDAVDLAVLGTALLAAKKKGRVAAATAAVAGVTALDIYAAQKMSKHDDMGTRCVHVRKTITIDRSPEDLYEFWRHFDRLPVIMGHLESVTQINDKRSHWIAKAPAGSTVEWDAEIINEHPNHLIAWRSLEGADVDNAGSVRFEPAVGNRGTVVKVDLQYSPPAGVLGAKLAKLFGEAPEQQIGVDLRRFKQLMETGEIARTEGQPAGRASST